MNVWFNSWYHCLDTERESDKNTWCKSLKGLSPFNGLLPIFRLIMLHNKQQICVKISRTIASLPFAPDNEANSLQLLQFCPIMKVSQPTQKTFISHLVLFKDQSATTTCTPYWFSPLICRCLLWQQVQVFLQESVEYTLVRKYSNQARFVWEVGTHSKDFFQPIQLLTPAFVKSVKAIWLYIINFNYWPISLWPVKSRLYIFP